MLKKAPNFVQIKVPGRLTVSAARTNVALFIHRAVRPQRSPEATPPAWTCLRPRWMTFLRILSDTALIYSSMLSSSKCPLSIESGFFHSPGSTLRATVINPEWATMRWSGLTLRP
jgi:hypothetical protein